MARAPVWRSFASNLTTADLTQTVGQTVRMGAILVKTAGNFSDGAGNAIARLTIAHVRPILAMPTDRKPKPATLQNQAEISGSHGSHADNPQDKPAVMH